MLLLNCALKLAKQVLQLIGGLCLHVYEAPSVMIIDPELTVLIGSF